MNIEIKKFKKKIQTQAEIWCLIFPVVSTHPCPLAKSFNTWYSDQVYIVVSTKSFNKFDIIWLTTVLR